MSIPIYSKEQLNNKRAAFTLEDEGGKKYLKNFEIGIKYRNTHPIYITSKQIIT